jgi:hypothetical protein
MRCATALCFAFALCMAPEAISQAPGGEQFYPFEEGNVWEYVVTGLPADGSNDHLMRLEVVGDTLLNDREYALVDVLERAFSLEVIAQERCATRYDEDERTIEWIGIDGACEPFGSSGMLNQLDFSSGEVEPEDVLIAGYAYDAEAVIRFAVEGQSLNHSYAFASGIGLVSWVGYQSYFGYYDPSVTLIYAEVGEAAYGLRPEEHDWQSFFPLSAGDMWEYDYSQSGPGWSSVTGYAQIVTVADTVIAGEPFVVATERHFDQDTGDLIAEGRFALRLSERRVRVSSVTPFRSLVDRPYPITSLLGRLNHRPSLMRLDALRWGQTVTVNGRAYEADVVAVEPAHSCAVNRRTHARGIGLIRWTEALGCGSGGGRTSSSWTLTYARVGGEEFGRMMASPIEGGGGSGGSDEVAVVGLYPSPASSWATLSVLLPTSAPLQLEVLDARGRRVRHRDLGVQPAGSSQHRLDLADLAAGLYVVRVRADSGETATRRLVKVD